eukprot:COSAG02_NODE_3223_length_7150_cov_8.028932_2_plen_86_part_00
MIVSLQHASPSRKPWLPYIEAKLASLLLNTKLEPTGEFDKTKARCVLDGSPRFMQKGVHFATVFAPTLGLETGRILQAYAVGTNK